MFYTVLLDDMIWYNPKNIAWIVVGGDQDYLSEILLQIQSIEMVAVMVGEWLPLFYWRWGGGRPQIIGPKFAPKSIENARGN